MSIKKQIEFRHVPHERQRQQYNMSALAEHEQIGLARASAWAAKHNMVVIAYTIVIKDYNEYIEDETPEAIVFILRPIADTP